MPRSVGVLLLALLPASLLAGCGDDGGSPGPEDIEFEIPVGARVTVDESGFSPGEVRVDAGEIVEFTNQGDERHRIVAEGHLFDTGDMLPGETFAFLAEEPGRIEYRDERDERDDGPDEATGAVIVERSRTVSG